MQMAIVFMLNKHVMRICAEQVVDEAERTNLVNAANN